MDWNRDCEQAEIQCIDLELDSGEIAARRREETEDGDEQNCIQPQRSLPPPYSPQQQQQSAPQNCVPIQGTGHSSTNNSGSRSTQRNQLARQRDRSRPRDQHLISEPPPPYPGLPVNSGSSGFVPTAIGASSPNRVMSTAPFPPEPGQPMYVLSSYGQVSGIVPLLPGQPQYSAVAQPRSTVGRASQSFPPPTATVIAQPRVAAQTATARVHVQGHPATDYLWFSYAMVALCAFQGNIVALICALPALAFSIKAQQYNDMRRFQKAKSYGRSALLCNILALLEYVLLIVCVSVLVTLAIIL